MRFIDSLACPVDTLNVVVFKFQHGMSLVHHPCERDIS